MIGWLQVSEGPTRPPGSGRPPSVAATPYKGMGVIKAIPPPIPAAARLRPIRIDTEPEVNRTPRSLLVGRADELVALREIVDRAIDFQAPQLVTLVGNQGTGKTRLLSELIGRLREENRCRVFQGAAERDANGKLTRFAAITSMLRARFELTPNPDEA